MSESSAVNHRYVRGIDAAALSPHADGLSPRKRWSLPLWGIGPAVVRVPAILLLRWRRNRFVAPGATAADTQSVAASRQCSGYD